MKLEHITAALERLAPLSWQEEYDNSGLQVGLFDEAGCPQAAAAITGVLVCLDITEAVIDEAAAKGCNLVVSHHPLLFRPVKSVSGLSFQQRCVAKALRKGIALYSAHTNLDNAPGGVSWEMGERIGLRDVRTLVPLQSANPAWDVNPGPDSQNRVSGSGVIGVLPASEPMAAFAKKLADVFGAPALHWSSPKGPDAPIRTVALCGGSGGSLIPDALAAGADCYVTGEIRYHDYFEAGDCALVALGHYESEQYTMDLLCRYLKENFPEKADRIFKTAVNTNPLAI